MYLVLLVADPPTNPLKWKNLTTTDQDHLVDNIIGHLGGAKSDTIKKRQVALFAKADAEFGARVAKGVNVSL